MLKVALIQMPWVVEAFPSLGLTQLKAVLKSRFGCDVQTDIHYLNLDVKAFLGPERYEVVSRSADAVWIGLGDWIFRQAAFPELPDNSRQYISRFYHMAQGVPPEVVRERMMPWARQLSVFLDTLIDRYQLDSYDIVGFTTLLMQNNASFAMARKLKQRRPGLITVLGGPHAVSVMGQAIARHVPAVDFVFSGPALVSFPTFIQHLLEGHVEKCHGMPAVFSKQRLLAFPDERIPQEEVGEDLDIDADLELEFDDYMEQVDRKLPQERVTIRLPFQTSQGCWWGQKSQCLFCGTAGNAMRYRAMSPANAIKQIQRLYRYWPRVARLHATDMVIPTHYLTEVLPHLKPPANLPLLYEVRADLPEAQLRQIADAGVTAAGPGIEALDTSTLRLMRKGTNAFINLQFLKSCVRVGITLHWNFVLGLPGMPEQVYRKYAREIPKLVHLPAPGGVLPVRILRFSPLFAEAAALGLRLKPSEFYKEVYPFPARDLEDLAYVFEEVDAQSPRLHLLNQWLQPLIDLSRDWMQRWYAEPRPQLTLELRDGQWWVEDTRREPKTSHLLSSLGHQLLQRLEQPMSLTALAKAVSAYSPEDVARELAELAAHDLLFEEDGKFLSLVILPAHGKDPKATQGAAPAVVVSEPGLAAPSPLVALER